MPKYTRCKFQVTGSYAFPTDMLRYDACYPESERMDSAAIDAANRHENGPFTVTLISENEMVVRRGPTDGRWRSFGWQVVAGSFTQERE